MCRAFPLRLALRVLVPRVLLPRPPLRPVPGPRVPGPGPELWVGYPTPGLPRAPTLIPAAPGRLLLTPIRRVPHGPWGPRSTLSPCAPAARPRPCPRAGVDGPSTGRRLSARSERLHLDSTRCRVRRDFRRRSSRYPSRRPAHAPGPAPGAAPGPDPAPADRPTPRPSVARAELASTSAAAVATAREGARPRADLRGPQRCRCSLRPPRARRPRSGPPPPRPRGPDPRWARGARG